jgi:3-methyladenine DNA glycosylase AlkD
MKIVLEIDRELRRNIDPAYKKGAERYFKEGITILGVKTPVVRRISSKYFSEVRSMERGEILGICEELLNSRYGEHKTIAFDWSYRIRKQFSEDDLSIFECWLKKYVSNWGHCDDLCNHTVGAFMMMYPKEVDRLLSWARSGNRWFRRASAVTLVIPLRKGMFLDEAFRIARILLTDADDLVQKGYGWMLKEASKMFQKDVFSFVMESRGKMPRTALRYAIEKMPAELRKQAMER